MTFEKAKARKDYQFSLNELEEEDLREQIINGSLNDFYENGDPIRGAAVLEIGFMDIEVNIFAYCQVARESCPEDKRPVIEYFICRKCGTTEDSWTSDQYLEDDVNVDWAAENWKEQLEKDMFDKLNQYVTKNKLSFNKPNRPPYIAEC